MSFMQINKSVLILLSCFLLLSKQNSAQDTVRVGAFNFYPGIFKDTDGKIKGFYVDALDEIAKKENIVFDLKTSLYLTKDQQLPTPTFILLKL